MAEKLEKIISFLDAIGDYNPIHRDAKKAYEFVNLLTKNKSMRKKKEQIIPGMYLVSQMFRLHETIRNANHAKIKFKDIVYLNDDIFIDESVANKSKLIVNDYGIRNEAIVAEFYDECEKKIIEGNKNDKDSVSIVRYIKEEDIKKFADSLDMSIVNEDVKSKALKLFVSSLISGALWKFAEKKGSEGFGIYNSQTFNFYNKPILGKFTVSVRLKGERHPIYFFETNVEQNKEIIVSGEAICSFINE